ncbi:MAG: ankyrin repeat domain-containing protein [Thermodesulfovibrionales bacterium]
MNIRFVPALFIMLFLTLFSCSKGPDKLQLNSSLFSVVSRGDDTAVRDLLKQGADANARDDNGCTPIARAASGGYLSTVKLLLKNRADVNTPCNHGPNALSLASSRGQEAIVRLLIEKGADVNRRGQQGWYPISDAIEAGHAGILRALIEHGAQINISYSYHTPLIHAAGRGRAEIVKILLDGGADVRAIDQNGMTALLRAIDHGHPEIAKMLIERGSDVNIRAGNGYRPLALARSKQQVSVVQALQAAGAIERAGPPDPFVEAAAREQTKINRIRKEREQSCWEFFISDLNVLYYLKPSKVASVSNGLYRIPIVQVYTNSDELFEVVLEMNCSGRTYRHISNQQRGISGAFIRSIPVDSYVLNDGGHVQEGSAMYAIFMRICANP